MKTLFLTLFALFIAVACHSQPTTLTLSSSPLSSSASEAAKDTANYLIRIEWKDSKDAKGDPKFLEVLTADGQFQLDTLQKNSVKINSNDVPVTLKLSGTLKVLSAERGRLQLFLGRTVPYVTGSNPGGLSSYSQMSVGLQSTFVVKFGKPVTIQNDESGEISVLVKRIAD